MDSVFVVQHLHTLPSDIEDVKMIGVYRSLAAAEMAVERLRGMPGFFDHPVIIDPGAMDDVDGFYIAEYQLDKDNWTEGFVTMIGDQEHGK